MSVISGDQYDHHTDWNSILHIQCRTSIWFQLTENTSNKNMGSEEHKMSASLFLTKHKHSFEAQNTINN
jgi:hypothetical protein